MVDSRLPTYMHGMLRKLVHYRGDALFLQRASRPTNFHVVVIVIVTLKNL